MESPKADLANEEESASGIWEWGMAEHLEDAGDSEPGGDGQEEEERPGTSEGLEKRSDEWLVDNGKEEMQLQPKSSEGQPETDRGEGHSCNQ